MAITRILLLGTLLAMIYIAFPVLAATRHHHRVTHVHPTIYKTVPYTGCPANGGPSCSNAALHHQIAGDEMAAAEQAFHQ
jgi:hypothetical protein